MISLDHMVRLILLLFLPLSVLAQRPPGSNGGNFNKEGIEKTVIGKIMDSSNDEPLEYATVSLINTLDNTVITGTLTEPDGSFSIKTKPGSYSLVAEFISFEKITLDKVEFTRGEPITDVGVLTMQPSSQLIEGVEIRAEKSETLFKLDKKIFTVGRDLANKGGTAVDILDNVPSITVDLEGNVNLRGSGNVRMLINGQPSSMVSQGNLNGLRSIPSSSIERIEVVTNPSAKYEAEGMAGIINIILKKEKQKGFNGAFTAGVGYPLQYNVGGQINYRQNNANFFVNFSSGLRKSPGGGTNNTRQLLDDFLLITDGNQERNRKGLNNRIQAGIDYNISKNSILTFSGAFNISDDDNENFVTYIDSSRVNNSTSFLTSNLRIENEAEDELNQEYSLTYKNDFGDKKQDLTIQLFFDERSEEEFSGIREGIDEFNLIPSQQVLIDESQTNKLGQLDFTKDLPNGFTMETGLRTNLRTIKNDYSVFDIIDNTNVSVDSLTDNFIYRENIYASYFIIGKSWDKWSAQLGVRAEHTTISNEFTNNIDRDTSYNYFRPFPTAHLTYKVNDKNAIQVSYSKRITRPRFWYLNPFLTLADDRNFFAGNPKLLPEYTDSYEMGHIHYFDKGTISSSLFYKYTSDVIRRVRNFKPDGTSVSSPVNLENEISYGLDVSSNFRANNWLSLDGNITVFNYNANAGNIENTFDASDLSWFGRVGARVKFWDGAELQTRFNYRAKRENIQGLTKAMYHLDFGISKDFLNDNLTVTLSSRDLLNTRKRRYLIDLQPEYFSEGDFQWRARSIDLNLSYRINQKKKRGGNRGSWQGGEEGF